MTEINAMLLTLNPINEYPKLINESWIVCGDIRESIFKTRLKRSIVYE